VLALYYYEELTMKEVGAALGIGESRVSQIHSLAMVRLRARLNFLTAPAAAEAKPRAAPRKLAEGGSDGMIRHAGARNGKGSEPAGNR